MKTQSIVLSALATFACGASAQSSVTLYGVVDIAGRYVKADDQPRTLSEATGSLNTSRFGVRGSEDLGGGLRAGFDLVGDVLADTGSTTAGGRFWNERSVVTLSGRFGELRLGRDFTPTYLNLALFDPFGRVSLGNAGNIRRMFGGIRSDNSIQYLLPKDLGGFYGQSMVAAGEGGTSGDRPVRYVGGRVGYAAGPANVSISAGSQRYEAPFAFVDGLAFPGSPVVAATGDTQKMYGVGGSWDFGVAKLEANLGRETINHFREDIYGIGAIIPFGLSEVHLGYDRTTLKNKVADTSTSVYLIKATYQYNLSKRTALYGTAALIGNDKGSRVTLPSAAGRTTFGGKSQGAEFGIRHFF